MSKRKTSFERVQELSNRPALVTLPWLVKICANNLNAATVLSRMLYWQDQGTWIEGWATRSNNEWTEETGLSKKQIASARAVLVDLGLVKEQRRGIPGRIFFQVDVELIEERWKAVSTESSPQVAMSTYTRENR